MTFEWTNERVGHLKRLHAEGKSASEIAAIMGTISRNAVIGKLHRLNLYDTGTPKPKAKPFIRTPRRPTKKADPVKVAEVVQIERAVAAPVLSKPLFLKLFELERNDCRWPVSGEKANTLFCGNKVVSGCSYCEGHHRMSRGKGTLSERNADSLLKVA